jgi:hypothetical protein
MLFMLLMDGRVGLNFVERLTHPQLG